MISRHPDLDDYLQLFGKYARDLDSIYTKPDDDRYTLLFEQVVRLLIKPSPFNLSLPEQFRISAMRYHDGDAATLKHLGDPANQHFMLSDLYDYIMLFGGLERSRKLV